ncbi:MAG: bifunctional demethylmenaquinone methyltransferase/2-methoxy-6-polyprenyl-1,4-benzoquinol methylase UbiE [Candidatus Zixiibacteriota bacterium]
MQRIVAEQKMPLSQEPAPSRLDVWRMFDRISSRYDLLNHLLSFGQDFLWRRKLAAIVSQSERPELLDLATGTGDLLLTVARGNPSMRLGIGLDMAGAMLELGQRKLAASGHQIHLSLIRADALRLPFCKASFDIVTIAFGIRNVENVQSALAEMYRVLRPSGKVLIMEFSLPSNRLLRFAHIRYLRWAVPVIGRLVSGDAQAYRYLNKTIESFPYGDRFCKLIEEAGFEQVRQRLLTFDAVTIYEAVRPDDAGNPKK